MSAVTAFQTFLVIDSQGKASDFNQNGGRADFERYAEPATPVGLSLSKAERKQRGSLSQGSERYADARPAQLAYSGMLVIRTPHSQAVHADAGSARRAFMSGAHEHVWFDMDDAVSVKWNALSCARRSHVHPL
jgi:hypothetical protein